MGYQPEMILAGRRSNDSMGAYVVEQVAKLMTQKKIHVVGSRVLILGLTFKENCPDLRNTRVIDMVREFEALHAAVDVHDPWVDQNEAKEEYGLDLVSEPEEGNYDAIILAVGHHQFKSKSASNLQKFGKLPHVLYDVKHVFGIDSTDGRI